MKFFLLVNGQIGFCLHNVSLLAGNQSKNRVKCDPQITHSHTSGFSSETIPPADCFSPPQCSISYSSLWCDYPHKTIKPFWCSTIAMFSFLIPQPSRSDFPNCLHHIEPEGSYDQTGLEIQEHISPSIFSGSSPQIRKITIISVFCKSNPGLPNLVEFARNDCLGCTLHSWWGLKFREGN